MVHRAGELGKEELLEGKVFGLLHLLQSTTFNQVTHFRSASVIVTTLLHPGQAFVVLFL